MATMRVPAALAIGCLWCTSACSSTDRPPPAPLDCSIEEQYEFLNISNFSGSESGWFRYADPTPRAVPNPVVEGSNIPVTTLDEPGRCGDTRILKLAMERHNFWGAGFGDWAHNSTPADGTGYDGISFWARSPVNAEKEFIFNVDDRRTILNPPPPPVEGGLPTVRSGDEDLDGDGFVGPGDIALDTLCRLPPPESLGDPACYNGGVDGPASAGVRVPEAGECGNAFHTRIRTTEAWQLFLIPWDDLVQWPCPNRLDGGIDRSDVAKFEVKLIQGASYDIWIDNIAFYRSVGN